MIKAMIDVLVVSISLKKQGLFHGCEATLGNKVMKIPEDIKLEKLEGCKKYLEGLLKEEAAEPTSPAPAATAHVK